MFCSEIQTTFRQGDVDKGWAHHSFFSAFPMNRNWSRYEGSCVKNKRSDLLWKLVNLPSGVESESRWGILPPRNHFSQ